MKAISLKQPWATLVALREKQIETRSWRTSYRGPLAIHASSRFTQDAWLEYCAPDRGRFCEAVCPAGYHVRSDYPTGAIVAVCDMVDCRPTSPISSFLPEWLSAIYDQAKRRTNHCSPCEYLFGDYSPRRHAWFLKNIRPLPDPIPCKGALSLWEVPVEVDRSIESLLHAHH